jgi:HEPN domain-containing protein
MEQLEICYTVNVDRLNFSNMENVSYAPWEHYPKTLRQHEVTNPMLVINDFFSANTVEGHFKRLKEWRKYVIKDQHYDDKRHGPATLLFFYNLNLKLLEGLYLKLCEYKTYAYQQITLTQAQLEEEKLTWTYYPKNLSVKEQLDPYKVINKAFKRFKPQQFRDHLHEWSHLALYTISDPDVLNAEDIISVYEQLLKLYSCAWIINQRDSERTELKTLKPNAVPNPVVHKPIKLRTINPIPTEAEKLALVELRKTILKRCANVQMIIHLGIDPEPFAIYLLILIGDEEKRPEHEVRNKIEDNCKYLANVHAIVHKAGSARNALTEGNLFWSVITQEGFIVYQAPDLGLPSGNAISNECLIANAESNWERWGKQGSDFLKGAAFFRDDGNLRLAAFHLHQSVESVLIAVIQAVTGYHVVMHNLSRLLRLSKLVTDELADIFKNETKEDAQLFALLQNAYSQSRYNKDFNPDEEQLKLLFKKVMHINQVAEIIYRQYVADVQSS